MKPDTKYEVFFGADLLGHFFNNIYYGLTGHIEGKVDSENHFYSFMKIGDSAVPDKPTGLFFENKIIRFSDNAEFILKEI